MPPTCPFSGTDSSTTILIAAGRQPACLAATPLMVQIGAPSAMVALLQEKPPASISRPRSKIMYPRHAAPGSQMTNACPKPHQGAKLCTLGTQCPGLCKQYRGRDKHNLPNPRRRRTSAHPRHEILSPRRHHRRPTPPKAQACAPSTSVTPPGKAAEAPNPHPRHKLVHPRHELPSPKGRQERLTLTEGARSCTFGQEIPRLGQAIPG